MRFDICMPFPSGRHVIEAASERAIAAKFADARRSESGLAMFDTGPGRDDWVAISPREVISLAPHR